MKELVNKYFSPKWVASDVLCVVGPTASGKTAFAVECARLIESKLGRKAEIISADSRQVYKGMDIGTGKDLQEYGDIPYHLIDIVPAGFKYDLYQYKRDFYAVYQHLKERGVFPILCGGSGLYVEAVCKNYDLKSVKPDETLRKELEYRPMEELIDMLTDLKKANGVAPHNNTDFDSKKRVIRAIEIEKAAGLLSQGAENESISSYIVGLNPSREVRCAKIDRRLEARLQNGLIEEVKGLLESGIAAEDLIYYGLEYKFVTRYLLGSYSYEYMKEHLAIAIHQFAKRQMTWLRGMERRGLPIEWINLE